MRNFNFSTCVQITFYVEANQSYCDRKSVLYRTRSIMKTDNAIIVLLTDVVEGRKKKKARIKGKNQRKQSS